jgi:hypothetical protein
MRNAHLEQLFSALHPKADSCQTSRHDRFVPLPEVSLAPLNDEWATDVSPDAVPVSTQHSIAASGTQRRTVARPNWN